MPERDVCCGLTWISTGQLGMARRVIRRTIDELRDHVRQGGLVVGLEPSCTAVFRSDLAELFPHDHDVERLRRQTVTLAELLHDRTPDWAPRPIDGQVLVQPHCHHHAVLGTEADRAVLEATGASVEFLDAGCCGLAGNFGFEEGHFDVSVACAERALLPAVRGAGDDSMVLADGFSCRTQIEQCDSGGRTAVHLAELLQGARSDDDGAGRLSQGESG